MTSEPITFDNIPGLTDEERRLYKMAFSVDDLRYSTFTGSNVNGTQLPDIVNGVVRR